jgi:hypothetical protein
MPDKSLQEGRWSETDSARQPVILTVFFLHTQESFPLNWMTRIDNLSVRLLPSPMRAPERECSLRTADWGMRREGMGLRDPDCRMTLTPHSRQLSTRSHRALGPSISDALGQTNASL